MVKKYAFFLLLIIPVFLSAQLSDLHYLPPLKQGNGGTGSINQQRLYFSTPETTPFDVNIYRGTNTTPIATISGLSNSNSQSYTLGNGNNGITLISTANTGQVLNNAGIRAESSGGQKFYLNYRGRSNSQATSLTSKGRQAIGTSFKWGGRPNYGNGHNTLNATLGIMATQNGTTINIFDFGDECTFRNGNDADGYPTGGATSVSIILQEGESYVLEAPRNNGNANIDCWLGASVQSNLPIVISNGNLNAAPLEGANSRDAGIDQPVPENVLGREYVFVRAGGTNVNETPIIIATQNNTEIYVNGAASPIATINNGDYFVIPGSNYSSGTMGGNMYVTTSKEVYAYQNIAGSSGNQTGGMNFIAPVNCLLPPDLDNIHNIQNVAGLDFTGGIAITAAATTPDANIIVTDNSGTVSLPASIPIINATGSSDWKTITVSGLTGNIIVNSTGPIAVGFFGVSGNAGIAGYFSGFDSVPVVEVDVTGGGCLPADIFEVSGDFDAYQWYKDGAPVVGEINSTYMPTEPGDFFVEVTRSTCTYSSAILSVYNCNPEIVISKTSNTNTAIEGDTVIFTIEVESFSFDPVTNLVINDVLPPEFTITNSTPSFGSWTSPDWTIGTIFPGEIHTLILETTVNEITAGTTVTNIINNTQDQTDFNLLTDDPDESVTLINNELEITKTDSPAPDGSYDTVGEIITYNFVVTNTGDQIIPSVTISDPLIDSGSLSPATVSNLGIGASANFTATYTITQADIETDQVSNSAIAQGTLSNGFVISDVSDDPDDPTSTTSDPTITPIDQKGSLVLEKIAQPAADGLYDALGEVITYELTVINTGNVSLDNVTITDPNIDPGSLNPSSVANLPAGASAVFTATHTIVQLDFDNGTATNSATVTGTEPVEGAIITDISDDPTTLAPNDPTVVSIPQFGQLDVTKIDDAPINGPYNAINQTITYTIVATSVGNVTLTNINLVDPNADTITLISTTGTDAGGDNVVDSMAPLETATFEATHIITQEDLDVAQVSNLATVGALDPGLGSVTDISDDPDDPTSIIDDPTVVPLISVPAISVTKSADDNSNVIEGQVITYTYTVSNTGNVTFDEVSLSDIHSGTGSLGNITLQSTTGTDDALDNDVDELGPGQTAQWTAEYEITTTDILNQSDITNTVTASATPRTGSIADPSDLTDTEIITVNPFEIICGGDTLSHDLTLDVDPSIVSFSWSATDDPLVSGETTSTSTASVITDTLTNVTTSDREITYTITGTDATSSIVEIYTYSVIVQPSPNPEILARTASICSGDTLNRNLISHIDNFNDNVDFSWSAADNINVTGETITTSTDDRIQDTLINTSNIPQEVIYTITPTVNTTGCTGVSYTLTITVDPPPSALSNPTELICSDVPLNHGLSPDVDIAGSSFNWSAADNPNVIGETTSSSTGSIITDTITNISGIQQVVIYTITPTSPDECVGSDFTLTVTIDPEPFVASPPTQTICSDTELNHDLSTDVDLTGSSFSWSATDNPNITGETTAITTTNLITDTLVNISGVVEIVIYTITPTSPDGCIGDSFNFTVTISPEPYVANDPIETICSNTTLNHDLNTDVNIPGTSFMWVANDNPDVTGETISNSTDSIITDTLINTSGVVQTVVYIILPESNLGCSSNPFAYTYMVTVNPEPFVATAPTQTICSDETLSHNLTADVNIPSTTFSWSAADNPNVTGETTANSTDTSITDTLVNISGTVQTVIYTISTTSPDGCIGEDYTFTVTVNPKPFVATAPTQTICGDDTLNHDLTADVNVTGTTFSWSAADNPNVTGETTTNSNSTSITDTLINISGTVQTVIYTITPTSPDGCVGDDYTFTVTINPKPFVATAPTQTICGDDTLNYDLTTDVNVTGTTFSWSAADNPNVTGETIANSTDTSITDTLVNISGTLQTIIYTITPTSPDGCIGDDYTFTVTINPKPFVATAPTQTICGDDTLNHDLTADVNVTGTTFSWSAADNLNVTGETTANSTDTSITDTLINISGTLQTVIYTITPTSPDGCVGDDYTFTVTINPKPFVTTAPTQTICGDDTLNHDLTTDVNVTGTAFSWSAADNPNITGETTVLTTTNLITDTLVNISGTVQTVIYTITPTSPDGCVGDDYTFTVTINPKPFVATAPTQTICSDDTLNHDLTTDVNVTGTTFSWSAADNPNVTGETTAGSTDTSITDTLVNISGTVQTVIYTITPTSPDGCVGDDYTFTVTINPKPFVATAPIQTICGDDTLNHDLTADVNVTGTTFSWSATDNPNVTGETTTNSTDTSITDTLVNISGTVQTVIYTITPTSPDGCIGDDYTFTVTVNPKPYVATAPTQTICGDDTLNHDLTADVNVTGTTFSWSAADNPNVTGETTANSTDTSITDTLVNISGTVQTVIYTITPTSPDGCIGDDYTFTVTINPKPFVATAPTQTICGDDTLNYDLIADVNVTGTTFSWSAADNPNVTGETTTNSTDTSITDTLVNISGTVQTVIYTITPTSPDGCIGDDYTFTVTINPKPFVATAPTQTICGDDTLNHDLTADVNVTGTTFSWSAADNPNITGETTADSTDTSITDTLVNISGTVQTVIYTITPTSPDGCIGDDYTFTVTINPKPFVATAPTQTICGDDTLNHDLTADVNVTGTTFSWSAADNPNVTGETTANSTDTSITDTLINISGTVQTVIYTITPTSPDGCVGDDYTFTVTINPKPFVATAPTQTICGDDTLNYDLTADVNVTGTTFSWSAADNPNVTGETTTNSTDTSITDTLINISGTVQTVIYTITPTSPDGCIGDDYTFTVTINPKPFVATAPTQTICGDDTLNHDLTTDVNVTGTAFSWSAADNPNVTGETTANSTNTSITDTLVNISGAVQTVIYTITPTSPDGCIGDDYTFTVTINPKPFVATAPTQTICGDD
ncbi:PKD-like domain-containing protein, partial [Aquimarina sp. 2201CG5-10]|uniref:PKD-like domain-containing protein n=1 Tax=Aquimarina callyspongiae TaxID=3098150 RepID=UPI002AB4C8E1